MARQGVPSRDGVLKKAEYLMLEVESAVGVLGQEPCFVGSPLADQRDPFRRAVDGELVLLVLAVLVVLVGPDAERAG
ncbi:MULTISPECIES: hypothetical protein [Streptomyces]|uniref:Uncharacterized protein n=1 Tax=Streptomyces chartreusis NRRL 3882 TaxID=1079985 RepID=A0A2N9BLY3_STRCX|nr:MULTISPECIES: hypothetical protein [Streptomyces]SOR84374.1 hypothetical protein SCNRRL3882_7819 [Streptomyces chartreusis NRRL 3882]